MRTGYISYLEDFPDFTMLIREIHLVLNYKMNYGKILRKPAKKFNPEF